MKFRSLITALTFVPLLSLSGMVCALEIAPYTTTALQQMQAGGKSVALHFHADWCPTCKVQEESFKALKADPQLKDVTLLVANYDTERELKKAMGVRSQSVVIVFKGAKETGRSGGETKPEKLKSLLATGL
jgi:thioredoxin 1